MRLLTPVIQDLVSTLRLRREAQTVAIAKDQTFSQVGLEWDFEW